MNRAMTIHYDPIKLGFTKAVAFDVSLPIVFINRTSSPILADNSICLGPFPPILSSFMVQLIEFSEHDLASLPKVVYSEGCL